MFPGGFSYGDDTGSGQAFANKMRNNLWKELREFIDSGKLIYGVCNGFQVMVHLGLFALPDSDYGIRISALAANDSNRYVCRWVHLKENNSRCVFTKGVKLTHLPVAHGEGRFFCDKKTLEKLKKNKQIVFTYCDEKGNSADRKFPFNPNGSLADIAGLCDKTGRIMGMMPHPERALYSVSEPEFHRKKELAQRKGKELPELVEPNLMIFKNAVEFVKNNIN